MSCSKREIVILAILYRLLLKTLAGENCSLIDKAELDNNSDSKSSFPNCSDLDEIYDLFFFTPKMLNAECMSVCYNGTNTTLMDAGGLQAYFVVYHKGKNENYDSDSTGMCRLQTQSTGSQNSTMCKTVVLDNPNEGKIYFGMFVPKECFASNNGEKICPLRLHIFNKSNGTSHEVTPTNSRQLRNLYHRSFQMHLKPIFMKYDDVNLEDACVKLDINIDIPDAAECDPSSSSECSTLSMCSLNCLPFKYCGYKVMIIAIIISLAVIISVLIAVVAVMCYREKCKSKQAHCTEREVTIPHINDNSTQSFQLNCYTGNGPSTSIYDPKSVVAISVGNAHDYEEPYFEPASKEEEIVAQINKLGIAEISRQSESLRLFEVIGGGAFGTVQRGVWLHYESSSELLVEEEVAVKSTNGMANEEERVKFLQEAAIMGQFNHPNIIKILGIVSDTPMMILIEIMKAGDLRNHILDINKSNKLSGADELPPTLLSYSRQVASGMVYLSLKRFIHRDLAARNILVSDNGTCKIADFGLSRDLQDATYYKSHGGKIPVKWTAPEALHYHKYSTASDMWSYGCVLYEIWSLGYKPFHEDTSAEVCRMQSVKYSMEDVIRLLLTSEPQSGFDDWMIIKKVGTGFRLPPPPGCPGAVYGIMIQCWHPEAAQRPSFFDVTVSLQKPDFTLLQWTNEERNICSAESRTLGASLDAGHQLHTDLQKIYVACPEQGTSWQQEDDNSESSQEQDEYKQIDSEYLYKVQESTRDGGEHYTESNGEDNGEVGATAKIVKEKADYFGFIPTL